MIEFNLTIVVAKRFVLNRGPPRAPLLRPPPQKKELNL